MPLSIDCLTIKPFSSCEGLVCGTDVVKMIFCNSESKNYEQM